MFKKAEKGKKVKKSDGDNKHPDPEVSFSKQKKAETSVEFKGYGISFKYRQEIY